MCPKDELLSAYLDREIESPYDKRLAAHLHTCERCRLRLESLQAVSLRLRQAELPDLEETAVAVERRLIATLEARRRGSLILAHEAEPGYRDGRAAPFWRRQIAVPLPMFAAGMAALFVLVASLFFFVGRSGNELQQARTELQKLKTVHVYYPVQNPTELMKAISDENLGEDVIIRLPENDGFRLVGEPEVMYIRDGK